MEDDLHPSWSRRLYYAENYNLDDEHLIDFDKKAKTYPGQGSVESDIALMNMTESALKIHIQTSALKHPTIKSSEY